MSREVVAVRVEGLDSPLVALAADEEDLRRGVPGPMATYVLAYEDPALKAYYATRRRYLLDVPPGAVFWHAGEALACVLLDGVVAVTWRWNASELKIEASPVRPLRPHELDLVAESLADTQEWLRSWPRHAAIGP
jgi:hypothetical protein